MPHATRACAGTPHARNMRACAHRLTDADAWFDVCTFRCLPFEFLPRLDVILLRGHFRLGQQRYEVRSQVPRTLDAVCQQFRVQWQRSPACQVPSRCVYRCAVRYRAAVGCSSTPPMHAIGWSSARDRPFLSFSFFHLGSCPCRPRQLGVRHDSAKWDRDRAKWDGATWDKATPRRPAAAGRSAYC